MTKSEAGLPPDIPHRLERSELKIAVAGDTEVARHLYVLQIDAGGKITDTKIGTLQVWQKQGEAASCSPVRGGVS